MVALVDASLGMEEWVGGKVGSGQVFIGGLEGELFPLWVP